MLLQFFVMFQTFDDRPGLKVQDGWVYDRWRIVKHYMMGWFSIDILSIVPSAFDFIPLFSEGEDAGNLQQFTVFRVIRTFRLVKLVRLVRASRLLKRWQSRMSLSFSSITVIACLVGVILSAHWYACIFTLQAMLHDTKESTWLNGYGYCGRADGYCGRTCWSSKYMKKY